MNVEQNQSIHEKVIQQLKEAAEGTPPKPMRVLPAGDGTFWKVFLPTPLAFSMEMFYGRNPNAIIIPVEHLKTKPKQAVPGHA